MKISSVSQVTVQFKAEYANLILFVQIFYFENWGVQMSLNYIQLPCVSVL